MTVIAVVGPTAAGKSELGIQLAQALGGEVVNADAMQLYRGMDIGTAKVAPPERLVPHHVFDVWDVTELASVAQYQQLARTAIDGLLAAGKPAILVGGSGLYVRAVLDRFEFPGTDAGVRARLEADLAVDGPAVLHARLAQQDPAAATAILPSNGRRIVRALEVIQITGKPFMATIDHLRPYYDAIYLGVDREPQELDERIATRVDVMLAAGFVEEVRHLLPAGLAEGPTASRALGYSQLLRFLAGDISQDEARAETIRATRRFVRRQRSWFRREQRISWLDGAHRDIVTAALRRIEPHRGRVTIPPTA